MFGCDIGFAIKVFLLHIIIRHFCSKILGGNRQGGQKVSQSTALNAKAMFHLVSGKPTKQSVISFGTDTTKTTIIHSTLINVAA